MKTTTWRRGLTLLLPFLLAGLFVSIAYADEGDPPARVARLSIVEGKVTFQPSGETDWSEASVNRPVTTGDRVYADKGARAELEVGPFAVRLSEGTDVTLANLNDQLMQLGVGQGTVRITVYQLPDNNSVEIDTPNGALIVQAAGSYRVDTAADGNSTQVTVNAGTLQISAGDLSKTLQSGEAVQLRGTGPVVASSVSVPGPDDFDRWCGGRDQRIESSTSVKSVGPAVPGGEDLDTYGRWSEEPGYGQVWYPANVPPDWVPYRNGHWAFIEPWGWTWVEAEPWGYAPFHYGRWAHIGPIWAWVPGPVMVRPVYAPALVAFVGGPGFGIGIGVGVQAWFPLGPREPFTPWYHHGPTYIREVNVVNVTNVTNIHYVNREVAVTAVSGDVFRGGQPVAHGIVHVAPEQLAHATVIPHPEVTPSSRAVFGARAVAAPPVPAARFGAPRPLVPGAAMGARTPAPTPSPSMRTPAPAPREAVRTGGPPSTPFPRMYTRTAPAPTNAPYAARQDAYSSHPGRPLEPQQMDNLRAGKPAGPMKDKESIPHPAAQQSKNKPAPSHSDKGHH
ncbi:MAG: DUF6600 domain-containing protein [Terriglobia bacterium]